MSPSTLRYCLRIARQLVELPDGKSKHFAYLLAGGKIVGFGYNKHRSHTYHSRWSDPARPPAIHAEAAAVFSTRKQGDELVVVRVNRQGAVRLSKPCVCCCSFLQYRGIKRVWFTTEVGWEKMYI